MKTLRYQLHGKFYLALWKIRDEIPCYVYVDEKDKVVYIDCREEDAAFVEKILAPYI